MLHDLGIKYNTDKAYLHGFCDIYEKLLNRDIKQLWEIGILDGASLNMWASYYPLATIHGFDIVDRSDLTYLPNILYTYVFDQGDKEQLKDLANNKDVDIIVDDGSHLIEHQIQTFEILFNCLKPSGQYILEDLHTSTDSFPGYGYENDKGALQYLQDMVVGRLPEGYPGQVDTENVMKQIKSIVIVQTTSTEGKRSLTSVITHI